MENWQINLSLIPSIAVVLTSANRMALGLTDEINVRLLTNPDNFTEVLPLKIQQLRRLSLAIIFMYISLAILILNAIFQSLTSMSKIYGSYVILVSIMFFLIGILLKIQFSFYAFKIRQRQFQNFLNKKP
ncbi:MAG: hypothetical protein WAT26_10575 [Saprospiraceae bacterium]